MVFIRTRPKFWTGSLFNASFFLMSCLAMPFVSIGMQADSKIHVRRGTTNYDVTVSNVQADIEAQKESWSALRDSIVNSITNHVETGELDIRQYANNFVYRYRPEPLRAFLVQTFEDAESEFGQKVRAARWLQYFNDERGFDWAVNEIENDRCKEPRMLLSVVGSWFDNQRSMKLTRKSLRPTPRVGDVVKDCFAIAMTKKGSVSLEGITVDADTVLNALGGMLDENAKELLQGFLEKLRIEIPPNKSYLADRFFLAYSLRFCDEWLFDFCADIVEEKKQEKRGIPSRINSCLIVLCRKAEPELRIRAFEVYCDVIRRSPEPIKTIDDAISNGVVFPESFLVEYRKNVLEFAKLQLNQPNDNATTKADIEQHDRYHGIKPTTLANAFAGTNDNEVIESLMRRLVPGPHPQNNDYEFDGYPNYRELFAIEAISGRSLEKGMLKRWLVELDLPIVQCECKSRINDKTCEAMIELFHRHNFATDFDALRLLDSLRQQVIDVGRHKSICYGRLLGSSYEFSSYERICGVYAMLELEASVYGENTLISDFWEMVDLTQGKFNPENFRIGTDMASGKTICGFTWQGKRFTFESNSYTSGLIPPLNAILHSGGIDESFVIVQGFPKFAFLSGNSKEVLYGPTAIFDELESEFGLHISVR